MVPKQLSDLILVRFLNADLKDNIAVLYKPFVVEWNDKIISVPAGYATDGSSVPGFVPGGLANCMTGIEASVVHDYFYETHNESKEYADSLFNAMLKLDPKVGWLQRQMMVAAVESSVGDRIYYKDDYVEEEMEEWTE